MGENNTPTALKVCGLKTVTNGFHEILLLLLLILLYVNLIQDYVIPIYLTSEVLPMHTHISNLKGLPKIFLKLFCKKGNLGLNMLKL